MSLLLQFNGDGCAFQTGAFQDNAFQTCVPTLGAWRQPFQGPIRTAARLAFVATAASGLIGVPWTPAVQAAPDNNVTIDKWLQPLSRAVPIPRPAGQPGGQPFVPAAATVQNTTNTVWPLIVGEVARPILRVAPQGVHLFVPDEPTSRNTTCRVWPLTQGEVARPISRPAQQGHHLFVPREATRDNTTNTVWPLIVGEVARPIPRPAQQGVHLFVPREATVDNTTVTVWPLTQGEVARPVLRPAPLGGQPFVADQATVQNTVPGGWWSLTNLAAVPCPPARHTQPVYVFIPPFVDNSQTIDKWQQPLSVPVPIPRYPLGWISFGYPYAVADNNQTIDKWQQPFAKAVDIPRPAPRGGVPFVPREAVVENTTVRVWPLTQGDIARPIPRAPAGYTPFVPREAVVDNTTVRVWPLIVGQIARPVLRVAPQGGWVYGSYASSDNNVTIDKWLQPLSRAARIPYAAPRGGFPFVPREATVQNTITGIGWWRDFTLPSRARPVVKTNVTYVNKPPVVQVIGGTVDQWLQRWQKAVPVPRVWRTQPTWTPQHLPFAVSISVGIIVSGEVHVCGWGTETEDGTGFSPEAEQGDAWSVQTETTVAYNDQNEQSDPWSEQAQSDDTYDDKDECGS